MLEEKTDKLKEAIQNTDELLYDYMDENEMISTQTLNKEIQLQIVEVIKEHHSKNKILETGLTLYEICTRIKLADNKWKKKYAEKIINELLQKEILTQKNNTYVSKEHKVIIDKQTEAQLNLLDRHFLSYGMQKPMSKEIETFAEANHINKDRLKLLLKYLTNKGILYFSGNDYLHKDVVDKCRKILFKEIIKQEQGINEKEFRLLIDGSKKIVQVLVALFINEGNIIKETFFLKLTDKGRKLIIE